MANTNHKSTQVSSVAGKQDTHILIIDLWLLNKLIPLISMHCDSQVAISKVTSKNFNEKNKTLKSET